MVRRWLAIPLLIFVLVGAAAAAQPDDLDRLECSYLLKGYLDALVAGDLDTARGFWRPADLAAAARLGLRDPGPTLKVDGDSPIWPLLPALREDEADYVAMPAQVVAGGPLDGVPSIMLACDHRGGRTRFRYYFDRVDGAWRLASPVRLACEAGPGVSGRYVTVHERRSAMPWTLPAHLTALLDSCAAVMMDRLELAGERRERLEREKLDYLLADPDLVERLAGAPVVGVASLQQDVVVTSHPCHAHELVHLLVNVWLGELPLSTLPVLQEGIAVHLGGRWGRHPRVLDRLGRTSLADGLVTLDELLTGAGFGALSAEISYPAAGVFAGFVLERFGADGLRRAYLALSGTAEEVAGWDVAAVQARMSRALGRPWALLAADLADHAARPVPAAVTPGTMPGPWSVVTLGAQRDGLRVRGIDTLDRRFVAVRVVAETGEARGALIFGGGDQEAPPNALFAEHFPGRPYRGETHALVFSPEEAKLYDYRRQMLVALHAQGFWPADDFAGDHGRSLAFGLRKDLLPDLAAVRLERDD